MRIFSASLLTLSFLATPFLANAHDIEKKKTNELKFPTEAEIEQLIGELPDFNGLMNGLMAVAQDEDLMSSLEHVAESMSEKMEVLEDMETQENGMPDFNFLMSTMLRTFADEELREDMMNVVTELQESVEENLDVELDEFMPELEE